MSKFGSMRDVTAVVLYTGQTWIAKQS